MTNPTTPKEVTQAAREAAADLIDRAPLVDNTSIIRAGGADDGGFVQAFARFEHQIRIEATERAARIAEDCREIGRHVVNETANRIATAIREDARHD